MQETHVGGCLCGAVTFEIRGAFERFFLCHCARCRKDTGSAHAANLFSTTARLSWIRGAPKSFQLRGTRHVKSFCATCGTALPSQQVGGGLLVVPAGCLETDPGLRPEAHIFCASRADWDLDLDQITCIDGAPT